MSKLAILVACKLKLREHQGNYPGLRLESTLNTALEGGLGSACCVLAALCKLKSKVGSEIIFLNQIQQVKS